MLPNFAERFAAEEHRPFQLGSGDDAALLIHGYPGTPAEMRPVAKILESVGWASHGLLLPGFGTEIASLAEKRHTDWQDAVQNEVVALKKHYRRIVLVGYSMGGALAINAASSSSIDGLILFSPFIQLEHFLWKSLPLLRRVFPKVKIFRLLKPNFADPQTRAGILNFMPNADLDAPEVQAAILDFELPIAMFDEIRILGRQAGKALESVQAPALVFQGLQDELVKPETSRRYVNKLPNLLKYQEIAAPHEILNPKLADWSIIESQMKHFMLRLP